MSTINIIGIVLVVNNLFIIIPLLSYSLYQFHRIQHEDIMNERKHKLVYCMNIISIISIFIFQPFNVFSNLSNIKSQSETSDWIVYILQTISVCSIYSLFLCKIWLLYFKQQYHTKLASQTWEKVINSRFNSWFVLNKNTYGNDRYILKLISIPLVISIVFESIVFYLHVHIHSTLFISLILTIPACIFYFKLQDFQNIHKIKNEIYYQCIIMIVIVFIYLIQHISEYITADLSPHHLQPRCITIINTAIGDFALFLMSISSSAYPVFIHAKMKAQNLVTLQIITTSSKTSSHSSTGSKCSINEMLNVIAHYHGYQAFMMHLVTEYATECLFFVTELIQIKHEYQRKHNNILKLPKYTKVESETNVGVQEFHTIDFNIKWSEHFPSKDIELKKNSSTIEMIPASSYLFNGAKGRIYCMIRLPIGIPKSEIMHSHRGSLKTQLYELYLKYIKIGCIHGINISSTARNIVEKYFKDYKKDENIEADDELDCNILNIMDAACIEVVKLMYIPYSRFYLSEKVTMNQRLDAEFISKKWNSTAIHKESSFSLLERQYNISS
eukprot:377543_1